MENKDLCCPYHKGKLVLREAKQGKSIGKKFWGCPTWSKTKCNYTLPYVIKKKEPTIKEKFLDKIKNKKGKISALKIIGQMLMIPIYIIGFFFTASTELFIERRKKGL